MSKDLLMGLARLEDNSADVVGPPPQQLKRMAELEDRSFGDYPKGVFLGMALGSLIWIGIIASWLLLT